MHAKYNFAEEYCPILPEQQPLTYSAEGSVKLHPRAEEGQRPYAWSRLRMHACPILSEQQPMLMSSRSAPQYIVHPADCLKSLPTCKRSQQQAHATTANENTQGLASCMKGLKKPIIVGVCLGVAQELRPHSSLLFRLICQVCA